MNEITIRKPDDFHLHFRNGDMTKVVVPHTAKQFSRAIVMPNLVPPVTTVEQAGAYKDEILEVVPEGFEALMTLYLTNNTDPAEITKAKESGFVHAVKMYPAGATTNSDSGVTDLEKIFPVLETMEQHDLPLLVHGEVTDVGVDIFDREKVFIEEKLKVIVEKFPNLRIVMEHVTTKDGTAFVESTGDNIAATITPQHLLCNRNDLLVGGIKPHYYCLPILKAREHQEALIQAATSGNSKFFAGTDSAPHAQDKKESACGCAGCYTGFHALELYLEAFDKAGKLDNFEAFVSGNGANFYKLPLNEEKITLVRKEQTVPESFDIPGGGKLIPFWAGKTLQWSIA